jgi:hypothetical protein
LTGLVRSPAVIAHGQQFPTNGKGSNSPHIRLLKQLKFHFTSPCCPKFQAVRAKFSSLRLVWDHVRSHIRHFEFASMEHLYEVIFCRRERDLYRHLVLAAATPMKMIGSRLVSGTHFILPMAFCDWGARWQCVFSASSYSSLGLKVVLGAADVGLASPASKFRAWIASE